MVTRFTGPPADGDQQHARVPAVSLPSIHDLNLGSDMGRDPQAQPPFAARPPSGFGAQPPPHRPHSRPALPHLPHSQTFAPSQPYRPRLTSDSFEQKVESAAPSPTQRVAVHTPATPSFSSAQIKDECPRCGAPLSSAQAECSCGHLRFIHPFQPHSRHLAAGMDDSFQMGSMSRRGSATRSSYDSCASNPPSRRGSGVAFAAGVTKSTSRKRSAAVSRKPSFQQELQKHNKADREKSSRRSLKHEHKMMEIRLQSRGWAASVELNSNNKKNSGLTGKKEEILKQTNFEARQSDLRMLENYEVHQRLLRLVLKGEGERSPEDIAFMQQVEREAMESSRKLRTAIDIEDREIERYWEQETKRESDDRGKGNSHDRYPTPLSSSNSPSPTPTYPHY